MTGATGFIGGHLVAALQARGDQVRALVREPSRCPDLDARRIDLRDAGTFEDALEGLDGVVHAAAHIPKNYRDAAEARACLEVNALGTLSLLRACAAAAVAKAVVLSGNVYRPGTEPVAEEAPIDPSAHAPYYLVSKACADFYADAVEREGKIAIAVLRPSAVYGPGLLRGIIPTFVGSLAAGRVVVVEDGGRYRADLVHVQDVATAAVAALQEAARGPFNVGSGGAVTALEIAATLAELLGAPGHLIDVREGTGPAAVGFPPLAIGRAREVLGYRPRGLREGLADYVAWWRAGRQG